MRYETRKPEKLVKGDIVYMGIPFEENTPDYYNGHDPKEIRGHLYENNDGKTAKARYIVVIGRDDNNIIYLPLTSRRAGFDEQHQYELQDNSMTHKKSPDMKSYVEIDSLRSVYTNLKWDIEYIGRVAETDMVNIMVKLGKRDIDFESKRDQRAYVSQNKDTIFEKNLVKNGYTLSEENFTEKRYNKEDGRTITKSKWGLVKYHVPLSKEEVTELVAKRENKPVEYFMKTNLKQDYDIADDFTRAVTDITEKAVENCCAAV